MPSSAEGCRVPQTLSLAALNLSAWTGAAADDNGEVADVSSRGPVELENAHAREIFGGSASDHAGLLGARASAGRRCPPRRSTNTGSAPSAALTAGLVGVLAVAKAALSRP
jgi:hypothetical protein